jgi:predicted metal-dependent hydrolase
MSKKSAKISAMIENLQGRELDAHYLGYFECFNKQLFYESHDVLEELWLKDKYGTNGNFYKGLIQLAGAFVHLQKNRLRPAAALFNLAEANLKKYPATHERLDVQNILEMIGEWRGKLETTEFQTNPLFAVNEPKLTMEP